MYLRAGNTACPLSQVLRTQMSLAKEKISSS
nr:MAG TPA: hypothetical protein [Caudoviricetes sp.]